MPSEPTPVCETLSQVVVSATYVICPFNIGMHDVPQPCLDREARVRARPGERKSLALFLFGRHFRIFVHGCEKRLAARRRRRLTRQDGLEWKDLSVQDRGFIFILVDDGSI